MLCLPCSAKVNGALPPVLCGPECRCGAGQLPAAFCAKRRARPLSPPRLPPPPFRCTSKYCNYCSESVDVCQSCFSEDFPTYINSRGACEKAKTKGCAEFAGEWGAPRAQVACRRCSKRTAGALHVWQTAEQGGVTWVQACACQLPVVVPDKPGGTASWSLLPGLPAQTAPTALPAGDGNCLQCESGFTLRKGLCVV